MKKPFPSIRRMLVLPLALLALLSGGAIPGSALAVPSPVPPKPDRYVTDLAGVLPLPKKD